MGTTLATFGAASSVVLGAVAMGSMAVIGQGVSDVMSGQVSSQEAYMSVGFWSAVAGAVSGMVGSGVSKFLTSKVNMLTPMAVNGLSGMVETVAENAVLGVKTNLSDLGVAFAASTALPVIGDNIARNVKQLTGQGNNVISGIKGLDEQLDSVLGGAGRQVSNLAETAAKKADDVAEAAAKQVDKTAITPLPQILDTGTAKQKEPPKVDADDEVEHFYNEIYDQQRATYPEYEQYLEDIRAIQAEDSESGSKGGTVANTLTDVQKRRLNTLENTINDHLTDGDFSGTLRDLQGNPVPNGRGGYFDHLGEMQNSYKSLQKIKKALEGSLKNPNLSDIDRALLQEGLDKANSYINKIEELFDPYGGIH